MNNPRYRCFIRSSDIRHVVREPITPPSFPFLIRMGLAIASLFGCIASGQSLLVNSGGPNLGAFAADSFCPTAARWTPSTSGYDPAIGNGIWADLIYGPSFSCDVSLPNGAYRVVLDLEENRSSSGKSGPVGPGTRVFSITANGVSTGSLDLFSLAGAQVPYQKSLQVQVTTGHLTISATASAGNAVMSAFEVYPVSPPLQTTDAVAGLQAVLADGSTRTVPLGAQLIIANGALAVSFVLPQVADWRTCSGAVGTSDCTGLVYLMVKKADGSDGGTYLATPAGTGFTLDSRWQVMQ